MSTATIILSETETILGKRKTRASSDTYILHLSSSPEPSHLSLESEGDISPDEISYNRPILINGTLVPHTKKRFHCVIDGCLKSYTKPSRLAEHERSHTGHRPFICEMCNKSYLREAHLQAHARSHLPESARPLGCSKDGCQKRFWTTQHLRVHEEWHNSKKSFICPEEGCAEMFGKNHQVRAHMCSVHAAPGTKLYPCDHEGCTKSFATNQHLRNHSKVHDEKRYTCVHPTCVPNANNLPRYYSTWTMLQRHIRADHPPTCSHPSCNKRVFTSQKGLRAHQKLHEQQELESEIASILDPDDEDSHGAQRPQKRRRGGEIGRDWKCSVDGCDKAFKSKKALTTHTNVTHLGRRDHICPDHSCQRSFGYKHLLQRHLSKVHYPRSDSSDEDSTDPRTLQTGETATSLNIDTITGSSYAQRARANTAKARSLHCPYPNLIGSLTVEQDTPLATGSDCEYAFSRAYDLRRHLKAMHGTNVDKERMEEWVKHHRRERPAPVD